MKKVILFAGLALASMAFVSCSNDETVNERMQQPIQEFSIHDDGIEDVKLKISALNNQQFNQEQKTRGLFSVLKKFFCVVISDAVGGIVGTAICPGAGTVAGAVSASAYIASKNVDNLHIGLATRVNDYASLKMNNDSLALNNVVIANDDTELTFADSIGYYHNAILKEMNEEGALPVNDESNEIFENVLSEASKITGYQITSQDANELIKANEDFKKFVNSGIAELSMEDDFETYCNELCTVYPEKADEIYVLKEFFKGLSNIDITEDDTDYIQKVLKIIEDSDLEESMKQNLKNAVLIGNASYRLWNVEDNL